MAISVVALLSTLLALEIPALIGWVDYRFTIGFSEHVRDPEDYPTHGTFSTQRPGDLVRFYGLANAETRKISFPTDGRGLRNESDLERADVIALGDSFVLNASVPQAQLFTTILSRRLGVPVANIGRSGWGPHDELAALRRVGLTLQPQVALWFFYEGNDLADTLRYGGHEIEWSDRLFLTSAYVRLAALVEVIGFGKTRFNYGREGGRLLGSCRTPCSEPPCERMYFGNITGPISFYEEVAFRRTLDVLAKADSETRAQGGSLVVVYAPVTLRVYRDICAFDEDSPARRTSLNDLPNRMQAWASSEGIGFVDLTPGLQAAAANGQLVYYPDDTHWTELGNAVVADALALHPIIVEALARH